MSAPGVAAVVLAAGSGSRMGRAGGKVLLELGSRTVLAISLEALGGLAEVTELVLVAPAESLARCRAEAAGLRAAVRLQVVAGGPSRHVSERLGLAALAGAVAAGEVGVVLVHDAARPFVSPPLVRALIAAAARGGAAIPALPIEPIAVERGPEGTATARLAGLWAAQTPQAFEAGRIIDAHRWAERDGFEGTDTASVLEHAGGRVQIVAGEPDNIKLTAPADLVLARAIAAHRAAGGGPFLTLETAPL